MALAWSAAFSFIAFVAFAWSVAFSLVILATSAAFSSAICSTRSLAFFTMSSAFFKPNLYK